MEKRIYKWDNVKAILIFLVVFGHFLTAFKCSDTEYLYKLIYLFHMPAFVFVAGLFSSFSMYKVVKRILVPYLIFQVLYIGLSFVLMPDRIYKLSFLYPHWLMWYMFALLGWTLTVPLLKTEKKWHKIIALCISGICALISGYIPGGISFLSASRMFSFYVFFVLGYYCKLHRKTIFQDTSKRNKTIIFALSVVILAILALTYKNLDMDMFRQVAPYSSYLDIIVKVLTLFAGLVLMVAFFLLIPNKNIKFLTRLGEHTLWIYLLHGFVVRYIEYLYTKNNWSFNFVETMIYSMLFSVVLCVVLSGISVFMHSLLKGKETHTIIDNN